MKKLMIMLLLSTAVYAQRTGLNEIKSLSILTGTIDGKYPITMYLWVNEKDRKITGRYYYNKHKKWISLNEASIPKDNNIVLVESVEDKTSGVFQGKYLSSSGFKGIWSSSAKSFPFDLKVKYSNLIDIYSYEYTSSSPDISIIENSIQVNSSNMQEFNTKYKTSPRFVEDYEKYESTTYDNFYLEPKNQILSFTKSFSLLADDMLRTSYKDWPNMYDLTTGEEVTTNLQDLIQSVDAPKFVSTLETAVYKQDVGEFFDHDRFSEEYVYKLTPNGIEVWISSRNGYHPTVTLTYNEIKEFIKPSMQYLFE